MTAQPPAVPAAPPQGAGRARSARELATVLVLVAVATVAGALAYSRMSLIHVGQAAAAVQFLGNVIGLPLMLARARRKPREALGWRTLAAAQAVQLIANGLLGQVLANGLAAIGPITLLWLAAVALTGILQCGALLLWPASKRHARLPWHSVLGCAVFALSILWLFWTTGTLLGGFQSGTAAGMVIFGTLIKVSLVAGIVVFLLAEAPSRIRGTLALVLVHVLFATGGGFLVHAYLVDASHIPQWLPGLLIPGPFALALAAWLDLPIEASLPEVATRGRNILLEALAHTPFLLIGCFLIFNLHQHRNPIFWPVLGFNVIAALMVFRKMLINEDLRKAKAHLEERVRSRTETLEEMQKLLIRTERMNAIAMLGAGISHDLNNLLASIVTRIELMEEQASHGQPISSKQLGTLKSASLKASDLTARVMGLGRKPAVMVDQDLGMLLESIMELLRMMVGPHIALDLERVGGPLRVAVGREQVEQVIVNLVGNARDALEGRGSIRIRLDELDHEDGHFARITIADDGPGIPREALAQLFEPFFTTKGTGLGLASVRAIVNAMGGEIRVDATRTEGAAFEVYLPVVV